MLRSCCMLACSGFCQNVLVGLVTGIVASALVLAGDRWLRAIRLYKVLKKVEGEYEHRTADGMVAPGNWRSTIKYVGRSVLRTRAWSQEHGAKWEGKVWMDEKVPVFGMGYAQHTDGSSLWGSHTFLIRPDGNINVLWTEEIGGTKGAVLWVRVGVASGEAGRGADGP